MFPVRAVAAAVGNAANDGVAAVLEQRSTKEVPRRDSALSVRFLIDLLHRDGRYYFDESVDTAIAGLPFPDPVLTLGEAQQLAKGRSPAARKLKKQIDRIVKAPTPRRKAR